MARRETREIEERVFKKVLPILKKKYGDFEIDPHQEDKPDFGIILDNGEKIGIEVTCYDDPKDLEYKNYTPKGYYIGKEIERLDNHSGTVKLLKKQNVYFKPLEIAKRLVKIKGEKYNDYINKGFKEVILLAYSNYFSELDKYHTPNITYYYNSSNTSEEQAKAIVRMFGKDYITILEDCFLIENKLKSFEEKGEFSFQSVCFLSDDENYDDAFLVYDRGKICMDQPINDAVLRKRTEDALQHPMFITLLKHEMAPAGQEVILDGFKNPNAEPRFPKK